MTEKVKCNSCNQLYDAIFKDTNQGINCASEVNFDKNEITCHYGSGEFDTDVYEFTLGEVPDWVEAGTICDSCIAELILNTNIMIKRKGVY